MATEVAILGAVLYGLCGRKATLNEPACLQKMMPAYVPSTGTDTQALERKRSSRGGRLTQLIPFLCVYEVLAYSLEVSCQECSGR